MSTFEPVPRPEDHVDPVADEVVESPEPTVNEPNKAYTAFLGVLIAMAAQWAASQGFDLDQEAITAALAPILAYVVYKVSNQKKLV